MSACRKLSTLVVGFAIIGRYLCEADDHSLGQFLDELATQIIRDQSGVPAHRADGMATLYHGDVVCEAIDFFRKPIHTLSLVPHNSGQVFYSFALTGLLLGKVC